MIIQPFIENAIWHGLLPKKGEKKLDVLVSGKNDILRIEVDDNGIGRAAPGKFRINRIKKDSLGIVITRERLDLITRTLGIRASVMFIDKGTPDQPEGTKVIITLPVLT